MYIRATAHYLDKKYTLTNHLASTSSFLIKEPPKKRVTYWYSFYSHSDSM